MKCFALIFLLPMSALADDAEPSSAAVEREAPPAVKAEAPVAPEALGSKQNFWRVDLGWRGGAVQSTGYAPFSSNDGITQGTLALSRTVLAWRRLSLAAGVSWDFSTQGQTTRGANMTFSAQRISVLLEGRVHVLPFLYFFARAAPGAVWAEVQMNDQSSFAGMADTRWGASFDASGGVALLLLPQRETSRARWWLTLEGGYGVTQAMHFSLKAQTDANDAAGVAQVALAPLALTGPLYRVTTGISF